MTTLRTFSCGGKRVKLDNGIELTVSKEGLVSWCSDWGKIYDLEKQGYLTHKFYKHNYGHTDFYLK